MISKNQQKLIRSLENKKYRKLNGLFVAEGRKVVNEMLSANFPYEHIYSTEDSFLENEQTNITLIDERELAKSSFLKTPDRALAIAKLPSSDFNGFTQKVNLYLDGIRDPGNLGTIIRLADWYGLKEIYCSQDCVDAFNPKAVQASMGSIFRISVCYVDETQIGENLSQNMAIYGAVMNGSNIHEISIKTPCILMIGNESNGIRSFGEGLLNERISIPKYGNAESLNAALATGILLDKFSRA